MTETHVLMESLGRETRCTREAIELGPWRHSIKHYCESASVCHVTSRSKEEVG